MRLNPDPKDGQYPRPRWNAEQRKRMREAATRAHQERRAEGKDGYGGALAPINKGLKKKRRGQ